MKWFKHSSKSLSNCENISAALETLGMEGYGFFWRTLEIIAEKSMCPEEFSATFSSKKWGDFYGFSAKKFEKFIRIFSGFSVFSVEFSGNSATVKAPILLELQDEWTSRKRKNSGVSPKILMHEEELILKSIKPPFNPPLGEATDSEETSASTNASDDTAPAVPDVRGQGVNASRNGGEGQCGQEPVSGVPGIECGDAVHLRPESVQAGLSPVQANAHRRRADYPPDFEAFWKAYPRDTGKGGALKAWEKARREGRLPDAEALVRAVENTLRNDPQWQDARFIPLAQTWLNQSRWDDGCAKDAAEPDCDAFGIGHGGSSGQPDPSARNGGAYVGGRKDSSRQGAWPEDAERGAFRPRSEQRHDGMTWQARREMELEAERQEIFAMGL